MHTNKDRKAQHKHLLPQLVALPTTTVLALGVKAYLNTLVRDIASCTHRLKICKRMCGVFKSLCVVTQQDPSEIEHSKQKARAPRKCPREMVVWPRSQRGGARTDRKHDRMRRVVTVKGLCVCVSLEKLRPGQSSEFQTFRSEGEPRLNSLRSASSLPLARA